MKKIVKPISEWLDLLEAINQNYAGCLTLTHPTNNKFNYALTKLIGKLESLQKHYVKHIVLLESDLFKAYSKAKDMFDQQYAELDKIGKPIKERTYPITLYKIAQDKVEAYNEALKDFDLKHPEAVAEITATNEKNLKFYQSEYEIDVHTVMMDDFPPMSLVLMRRFDFLESPIETLRSV